MCKLVSFHTDNSSLESATELKSCHSAPLEVPFPTKSFLGETNIFSFWPKTMDYI